MSVHLYDLIRAAGVQRFEAFAEYLGVGIPEQPKPGQGSRAGTDMPDDLKTQIQANNHLLACCRSLLHEHRKALDFEAERICALASMAGQAALESLPVDQVSPGFFSEPDPLLRALSLRMSHPALFEQAEDAYYVNVHRLRAGYDAFQGVKKLDLLEEADSCSTLAHEKSHALQPTLCSRLAAAFQKALGREGQLQVECFERLRPADADQEWVNILHWRVFSEGSWRAVWKLMDNDVLRDRHRPVDEFQLLYEVQTGLIEVYADRAEDRHVLAQVFMQEALGMNECAAQSLPKRRYNVEQLKNATEFKVDPQDDIVDVAVTMLKFRDEGHARNYESFYSHPDSSSRLHDRIRSKGAHNAIDRGALVLSASLCVQYLERTGKRRRLQITFGVPNRCTLKASTTVERALIEKYLPRWNLIENLSEAQALRKEAA